MKTDPDLGGQWRRDARSRRDVEHVTLPDGRQIVIQRTEPATADGYGLMPSWFWPVVIVAICLYSAAIALTAGHALRRAAAELRA